MKDASFVAIVNYGALLLAIVFEVIATSSLKESAQFTRFWPSLVTIVCYGLAFYFLSLPLKNIPVGVVYAIWSGVGIVLITAVGFFVFKQTLDWPALIGIALIMAGVIVLNVWSKAIVH